VIIRVRWNLDLDLPEYMPRFNVAPETWPSIPVIIRQKSGNKCRLMIGVDSALGRRPFYPQSDDERQSRNIDGIAIFQPPRGSTPLDYSGVGSMFQMGMCA
jgi:hypothetical protein